MNPPLTRQDLSDYFARGCKKPDDLYVGVEWEKIGVYRESGRAISYTGPKGVEAIFSSLIARYGWQPEPAGAPVIALKKGGHSITLEPGGQIELSGQKARRLDDNAGELYRHLEEIRAISEPMGIAWLGIGAQPFSTAEEIEWVPKKRYKIMRESLAGKGALTFSMMKETASVQMSLDFLSEEDAILKLKLGMGLSPFLVAMFANSPLKAGLHSGFLSRRANIWEHTAPERSGILWDALRPEEGFKGYIDYALKVPMLFLLRGGDWLPVRGICFEDYLKSGYEGLVPTIDDWQLHLSGIFTEARLKHVVEIRSIDCQKTPMGMAAVALIKGLFYHEPSRKRAIRMISGISESELKKLHRDASVLGLNALMPGGGTMQAACLDLLEMAAEGLGDEKGYLDPLKINLEIGTTPAELILACFDGHKPLLSCTAIEG